MEWWFSRRSTGVVAETIDTPSGLGYMIIKGKGGKFWVEAHRVGGAKVRLPWQQFDTIEQAVAWVEARERGRS
jgi:hypothetical protein